MADAPRGRTVSMGPDRGAASDAPGRRDPTRGAMPRIGLPSGFGGVSSAPPLVPSAVSSISLMQRPAGIPFRTRPNHSPSPRFDRFTPAVDRSAPRFAQPAHAPGRAGPVRKAAHASAARRRCVAEDEPDPDNRVDLSGGDRVQVRHRCRRGGPPAVGPSHPARIPEIPNGSGRRPVPRGGTIRARPVRAGLRRPPPPRQRSGRR